MNIKLDLGYGQHDYTMKLGMYDNGLLAVFFKNIDNYKDDNYEDSPIISINLGEFLSIPNAIYLDVELFSDDLGYKLEQAGLGKLTSLTKHSGYMAFPIFIFDEEILRKADSKIYSKYIDNFEENSIKAIINL